MVSMWLEAMADFFKLYIPFISKFEVKILTGSDQTPFGMIKLLNSTVG